MERTYSPTEAQALYFEDLKRQRGQRGRLLELFLDGLWHPNYECADVGGLSFNDSIFALRQTGWIIESRRIKGGIWQFRLVGKDEPREGHKPMTRPQRVVAEHYMHIISDLLGDLAAVRVKKAVPPWMSCDPNEAETTS